MSWRKFTTLVRCLSPNSATINHMMSGQYIGGKRERVVALDTPQAAQAAFEAAFAKK